MKTLRDEKCRIELIDRINRLTVESKASWGRMNVEQMLSHLVQTGELPFTSTAPDHSTFARRNLIKPLALYLLPMPKEIKTSAQIDQHQDGRKPLGFDLDKAELIKSVDRLGTLAADHECNYHPYFGKMSAREWGLISHKHMDHHLRQFGV
jgi:hypothetical protein